LQEKAEKIYVGVDGQDEEERIKKDKRKKKKKRWDK
jgi:hypothetical protein